MDNLPGSISIHTQGENFEADTTVVQVARLIAEYGTPKKISYSRTDINDWPGQDLVRDRVGGVIEYSEIEEAVLVAARNLSPDYAELSLEEIGSRLKEESHN